MSKANKCVLIVLMAHFFVVQSSDFEVTWKEMQQKYSSIYTELKKDVYSSSRQLFYHPQWQNFSTQIKRLIMGNPNDRLLRHPTIAATMVRSGMKVGQTYEMCYLNQCISRGTKELLERFKEETAFGQSRDCSDFNCSANTLGQLYYAARIFENMDADHIRSVTEFGGGFGCLAYIFKSILPNLTMNIIDIPELLAVQYVFLKSVLPHEDIYLHTDLGAHDVEQKGIHLIPVHFVQELPLKTDVFVSNFALSEVTNYVQKLVGRKNFFNAKLAYITGQLDGWNTYGFEHQSTVFEMVNERFRRVSCQPFHLILSSLRSYEIIASI